MASALIEFRNVALSFGDECLLRDVNFSIQKGEAFSIIGPSGHGKSVVMKLMAGLMTPTSGDVLIDGQSLVTLRGKERERLICRMGMLFQKNALFDSLTVGENVAFPLREVRQAEDAEVERAIQFYLEAVGILHAKDLFPDEISGGMQKRLGIARALALKPEIVLYDDPTAGLDPITSRKIIQLIMDLRMEYGSTIVAITNDMHRAYQLGGRIAMVVDREVIVTGDHAQTLAYPDPRVHQFVRGLLQGPLTVTA